MPGPGSRNKAKSKKTAKVSRIIAPTDTDEIYSVKIDNAEGWDMIVDILCDYFKLPDLATRSGLKKIHVNFDTFYNRINSFYEISCNNYKVKGGIVGIFAKMCVDSILRNKLFDKGVVEKIVPLLNVDETRHLALRALSTITHHGGSKVRAEIARQGNVIAKLIRDLPDDEKVADLGISVLAHSVSAAVEGDTKPAHPHVLKSIDMVDILKSSLEAIKRPHSHPRHMLDHAIELVTMSALHAASTFKAYPSAIGFLVAGMRSKDWVTRSSCLGGLMRLYHLEGEDDQRNLDPNKFMAALQRGTPDNLTDILMDYGQFRSEIFLTLWCTKEFQNAMMACMQTKDLYSLGLKQAELIMMTEFAIANGMFETEDPKTGRRYSDSFGLPFKMWSDSLPHCAKAIRNKKKAGEQDLADILDIKYAIMKHRIPDAVQIAKKGIERNPNHAYFYYAITLSADNTQGLRAAKKGLKCSTTSDFIKYQLMQRSVEHAGSMGINILQSMPEQGERRWEEGIAFLTSALEDAKTYIEGAPPDNRHMKNVGYWYVLLTMLLSENLSPNLEELEKPLERLKIADQFSEFMGVRPPQTILRLTQKAAVQYYASGIREFSQVFERLDKCRVEEQSVPKPGPDQLEDDLKTWLEDMHLEDGTREEYTECGVRHNRPKVVYDNVILYRCSYCGNPSAGLRKCSGCGVTRYCDSGCQKAHWPEHKKTCKH